MRILPISDLHHELWKDFAPRVNVAQSKPDVVVLAGDMHTGAKAVTWAAQTFRDIPVLYVHGNHEAYGGLLEETQDAIATACAATENVRFLNCDEFIHDGVRFLGATLWTDYGLFGETVRGSAMREAEAAIADYRLIHVGRSRPRLLSVTDTIQFHQQHKAWLKKKLAEPFDGKTVVITHMAPSFLSVSERYAKNLVSAAFASHLDELAAQADVWIHGHMHESFDYRIGDCRVVCNPCGYMTRGGGIENGGFDPSLIITL